MRKINTSAFVRATRSTTREINRRIALNLVREHQPISRADLARRMRTGRGMVTSLVDELLADGSIYEGAPADRPRGRRPTMLFLRTRDRLVAAIDVRLTRTFLALADFAGTTLALDSFATPLDPPALAAELARRVTQLLHSHGDAGRCEGIGLVVPGMVDHATGRILNAPQLGWRDVDLRAELAERTGLPVQIENAPAACALAHMWLGGEQAFRGQSSGGRTGGGRSADHEARDEGARDDFVYVTVSDGVGAALVVNGTLVRGHTDTAGEFGHVPVELDGPRCLCGARGCLEVFTSNLATVSRYLGRGLDPDATRARVQDAGVAITDVIERARDGEPRALGAVESTARYLGVGLAVIVNAVNPSRIVVGGEVADAWHLVEPIVRAAIAERALTPATATTPVVPESGSGHPRLRGATALVAARHFAAPVVA